MAAERSLSIVRGGNAIPILVPVPKEPFVSRWVLRDDAGKVLAEQNLDWKPPRKWTFYLLSSTHADFGLHKAQYLQRKMTTEYIEAAGKLADKTSDWPADARYRYNIEGTWFWSNYPNDFGDLKAAEFISKYVKPGFVSISANQGGNHTTVYGFEELCRSSYYKRELKDRWGIDRDTMVMADNNGLSWSLVGPYADAGIKNIYWLPNKWNPGPVGGARVDTSWTGPLPLLFYWEGADRKSKILFWIADHYGGSARWIGLNDYGAAPPQELIEVERVISKQMQVMEEHYPYDIWLFSKYCDDEAPNLKNAEFVRKWNEKWAWPNFKTVADLSEPFARIREKYDNEIPTLSGDIPCGWAQHPVCAPELLAQKFAADRLLPTAEKAATLARLVNPKYIYPQQTFRRAWDALLTNDEHSYGTSGYKGRNVYETWLQHRDWIDKAEAAATSELSRAMQALGENFHVREKSILLFNPTLLPRTETIQVPAADGGTAWIRTPEISPLGCATVPVPAQKSAVHCEKIDSPPVLENEFYRVEFNSDGAIRSIQDKKLGRELLDLNSVFKCNQFVYTKDNHKTFTTPKDAKFELERDSAGVTAVVALTHQESGAEIWSRVRLPNDEKRIEIDNRFLHVYDLFNQKRYYRFGYAAFPFAVDNFQFYAQLNGVIVRPKIDKTGHTTDSYSSVREWSSVGNEQFTVGLIQLDSTLTEFGKIHADKKEINLPAESSHIYSYLFTDWLQMHTYGGSAISPRFRYVITSGEGDWRKIGITKTARLISQPIVNSVLEPNEEAATKLPAENHSFLSTESSDVRLLTLKAADSGEGIIARFLETDALSATAEFNGITNSAAVEECSVTECDRERLQTPKIEFAPNSVKTLHLTFKGEKLAAPAVSLASQTDAAVGIKWNTVDHAVQYNLYRGDNADFEADIYHLLAATTETCYVDKNLGPGENYFYRAAAVDSAMNQGPASAALNAKTDEKGNSPPAPIGAVYTGLATEPRAVSGDEFDQLYLEWGRNMESDLDHYELVRSEKSGFAPGDAGIIAKVEPGIWRIVRYEDRGLKTFTRYYYRVRAVDRDGNSGPWSAEFFGTTREPYRSCP